MKTKKNANKVKMKRAFTLIEMLIVIAIIGVLAAVLIFAVSGARGKANAARAKADMLQIKSTVEKASDVDGCIRFHITTSGNAATVRCVTNSTDYGTIQVPSSGSYILTVGTCVQTGTGSTWTASGTCDAGSGVTLSTYSFQTTGFSGEATNTYTCNAAGCLCSNSTAGICDTL